MVNRSATKHLLFIVSILLCFFIYMGYRLFGRGTAEPAVDSENEFASYSVPADGSPLRPQGMPSSGLKPPSSGGDADAWIPSARGEDLALVPEPSFPVSAPPGGGSPFDGAASASSPSSGAITGLIPSPPSGGSSPSSAMRPPSDSFPAQMTPPGGSMMPMENMDDMSSTSSPFAPSGLKPPDSGMASAGTSLPVPSFSGDDAPMEMGSATSAMPSPPGSSMSARPVADSAPSYAPPAPGGYVYQETTQDAAPPATRPPVPPPASRPTPAVETRPPTTATPPAPRTSPPSPRPAQEYAGGYDYDDDDEEDDMPSGSESLRIYVVRPGDTLSNIAARELGSISLADNIFLLNRDVIDDPDQLMVGVKIRLPVRDGAIAETPGVSGAGVRRPTVGTGRTHVVARGDTLSSIAQQYYGSSATWRFLYEANKNIVPDANRLSVGTELTIPPYEEN